MNEIIKRMKRKTPLFFKRLRNISFAVAAAATAVLATPADMPSVVINIAGYLVATGTVVGTISQTTVKRESK
jgi:ABC-type xylose transport system permease subunit